MNKLRCVGCNRLSYPGEVMLDEIEARELKKSTVAKELDILPGHLSEMFKGKRSISAMTAVKLEKVFGVSAEFRLGF